MGEISSNFETCNHRRREEIMPSTEEITRFFVSSFDEDAKLRAENPGLQELWDQYQTMLKLVKPAIDPREETVAKTFARIKADSKARFTAGIHIEADIRNPCGEIGMPDKPPGKIELNGREIAIEDFNRIFGKRK